jgi:ribonucleoside-diphosphate reductase alpha chain
MVVPTKYVNEHFSLSLDFASRLQLMKPDFGYDGYGELVFFRTYSRIKTNGGQENWADVVTRVINGTFSIRKDFYARNYIRWDEEYWQAYAYRMAISLFNMHWFPGGRGLWAMGTSFIYERGSMALNNCGYCVLGDNDTLANDLNWMMDALMLGVGVGFEPKRTGLIRYKPVGTYIFEIPDSREGWADSVKLLVEAYTQPNRRKPIFKYDKLREEGLLIKGFGGKASGPVPLKRLHENMEMLFESESIDEVRLKADIGNILGVCVVAGNVRRSAELMKGDIHDPVFMNLKDYDMNPERQEWGWMSNNTAVLYNPEDFEQLGEVAKRITVRGEPGILNLKNFPFGRIGKPIPVRKDKASGLNPLILAA